MAFACKAALGNSIIVPTIYSIFILCFVWTFLATLLTRSLSIFSSKSVEIKGIIISAIADFDFSLVTGIGKYDPKTGVSVESADLKDIDTVVAKLDELFAKGKPTIEFNTTKLQAFTKGAGAAKLFYVVKVGGMDIMKNEIRYKGSFTAQPQFFAVFTEKFKELLKPTEK